MSMINNQHQQLQVKFTNLQNSLEIMTKQKQIMFKAQVQFIQNKELSKERIVDLEAVLRVYRNQVMLVDKIATQNKQLKAKYAQLQANLQSINQKIAQTKYRANTSQQAPSQMKNSGKSRQQTQPDDDKNIQQYKLTIQTKQHMITAMNKKLNEMKQKQTQQQQKINDLKHQLQRKQAQIKHKEQDIARYQHQANQTKKKINEFKQYNQQLLLKQSKLQEDIKNSNNQLSKLSKENVEIRNLLALSQEEKKILASSRSQNEVHSEDNDKRIQLQRIKFQHDLQSKDIQLHNLQAKLTQTQSQNNMIQTLLTQHKKKQKQAALISQNLAQQLRKNKQLTKKIQDLQQSYQIRIKKLQFNTNQQRIKADALKRSLTNLQIKQQQSRKQLDQMYEKRVVQDNQLAKLQAKVKSYKQMISYLQKQKVQMQKTFQNKMRNMQQYVLQQNQQQQYRERKASSQPSQRDIIEKDQAIIAKLNSRIVDLQQQNNFLRQQNKNLSQKKDELQQSTIQLQKNFKAINAKRQEMMKQFSKMGSIDYNIIANHNNTQNNNNNKTYKQDQKLNFVPPNRAQKVAEKALKGFQILAKILNTLYKQFMNFHVLDLQRKQIKDIEGHINLLVRKCQDMKDIFQGYLQ